MRRPKCVRGRQRDASLLGLVFRSRVLTHRNLMLERCGQSASRCQRQVAADDGIRIAAAIDGEADASQNQFRGASVRPPEPKSPALPSARIDHEVEAGCSGVGYLTGKAAASLHPSNGLGRQDLFLTHADLKLVRTLYLKNEAFPGRRGCLMMVHRRAAWSLASCSS